MALTLEQQRELNNLLAEANRLASLGQELDQAKKEKLAENAEILASQNELSEKEAKILEDIVKLNERTTILTQDQLNNSNNQIDSLKQQQEQLKKINSALQMMLDRAKNITNNFSSMRAQLNKSTTDAAAYAEEIRIVGERIPGLSFGEAQASQAELIKGMSNYTRLTSAQRMELNAVTSTMDKLGFSSSNTVKLLEMTTKSLGMTTKESSNMLSRFKTISEELNIPMTELDKNFTQIGDQLARFGKENYEKTFVSLSMASKNLGIEVGKLLDITEGFTTFEGAASAAGQLNAILGGNFLNSINLTTAALENPVEAIRQVKTAFDQSGKSFGEMSLAQQRYVASILKMDVGEAGKLMSQSLGAAVRDYKAKEKAQKELEAAAAKSTDVMNRFSLVLDKIIASPIITWTLTLLEGLASLLEMLSSIPVVGELLSFVVGIVLVGAFFKLSFAGRILGGIISGLSSLFSRIGPAGSISSAALLKVAGAVALLGIGIGAAMWGISKLADAMKGMTETDMKNFRDGLIMAGVGILVFIGAIVLAGKIATAGALGIAAVSLALLAVGAAIGIVAAAFAIYNSSQAESLKAEQQLQAEKNKTIQLLNQFGATLVSLAQQESIFTNFASGIEKIGEAIDKLDTKKMTDLASLSKKGISFETSVAGVNTKMPIVESTKESQKETLTSRQPVEAAKEVKLTINSPVYIDGVEMGKMIYNGMALWEESKNKEITPVSFTTKQLKDGSVR